MKRPTMTPRENMRIAIASAICFLLQMPSTDWILDPGSNSPWRVSKLHAPIRAYGQTGNC
jgi:hypothetical protein